MSVKIIVKRCPYHGRRPNLTPQETPFPYNESPAPVPLVKKPVNRAKGARVLAIIGTVFVWIPLVLTLAYVVYVTLIGKPQPVMIYVALFSSLRILHIVGGILLYIAARFARRLSRPVGWAALGMAVVPFIGSILMVIGVYDDVAAASQLLITIGYDITLAASLFALCLNVLSIFLMKGLLSKKQDAADPDTQIQPES